MERNTSGSRRRGPRTGGQDRPRRRAGNGLRRRTPDWVRAGPTANLDRARPGAEGAGRGSTKSPARGRPGAGLCFAPARAAERRR